MNIDGKYRHASRHNEYADTFVIEIIFFLKNRDGHRYCSATTQKTCLDIVNLPVTWLKINLVNTAESSKIKPFKEMLHIVLIKLLRC